MIKEPKLIIFDLDGTVYEDIHHFDYYVNSIKNQLPEGVQGKYLEDYQAVLQGEHPLKFGRIYDTYEDLIIVQVKDEIREVYAWDGSLIDTEKYSQLYPQAITIDMFRYLSIGDLWWVPSAIASHYGLERSETQKSFFKTREYMMGPEFEMVPVPGFKQTLESLKGKIPLILMTNSPEIDSEVILKKLGLNNIFTEKIFNATKPTATLKHLKYLSEKYRVPYTDILSIGDNYINEILPAQELCCQTIYIDYHNTCDVEDTSIVVQGVRDVIPYLQNLVE